MALRLGYEARRLPEVAGALWQGRRLVSRDAWERSQVEELQGRQLAAILDFARRNSAFYREHYRSLGDSSAVRLSDLPPVGKDELMDAFDGWVTDGRLRLPQLHDHIEALGSQDEYYLGRYRVMTTGGSSGRKGVFAFDRREWRTLIALTLRWGGLMDVGPRLPNRLKAAAIAAGSPLHVTYRVSASLDVGLVKQLRLHATEPVPGLVAALNEFQPEHLHAYPSIAALLADEQLEGRLNVNPRVVSTSSELRTSEMVERIRSAWGVEPFDCYGVTEVGLFGAECDRHRGVHAFDDLFVFEVVDEDDRAVPDGEVGHHVLVTNLFYRTQPVIRYRLDDMIGISTEGCPCGRPFPLLKSIEGRSDDVLQLSDGRGGTVSVHPMHFRSPLAAAAEVKQYQVVQRSDEIVLRLVPAAGVDRERLAAKVASAVEEKLRAAGADPPPLRVELLEALERDAATMSKLKLVRSEVQG